MVSIPPPHRGPTDEPSTIGSATIGAAKRALPRTLDRVLNKLNAAWQTVLSAIEYAWQTVKNPIDPDWRKNQKYHYVLSQIGEGAKSALNAEHLAGTDSQAIVQEWIEGASSRMPALSIQEIRVSADTADATFLHLKRATDLLFAPQNPFWTQRQLHKEFMREFELATSSKWYLEHVLTKTAGELRQLEKEYPELALMHAIAFALFREVNMQGFTQDLTSKIAMAGGFQPTSRASVADASGIQRLQDALTNTHEVSKAVRGADSSHKIFFWTSWGSSVRGSLAASDFNPLNEGNPPNTKYRLQFEERAVTCVRVPTPTRGRGLNPAWIAFGYALKARGQRHNYFNLQDRRHPDEKKGGKWLGGQVGIAREDYRSHALEALNKHPDLKDVFCVLTFDKNSDFYRQHVGTRSASRFLHWIEKKGLVTQTEADLYSSRINKHESQAEALEELVDRYRQAHSGQELPFEHAHGVLEEVSTFQNQFIHNLFNRGGSFYLPDALTSDSQRKELEGIVKSVAAFFPKTTYLTPKQRQDYIEITYKLLVVYVNRVMNVDSFNTSCKDCIDRGGGENYASLFIHLLLQVSSDPTAVEQIEGLAYKMDEDALWARKREIIDERRLRAIQACQRMLSHPELLKELVQKVYGGALPTVVLERIEEQKASGITPKPNQTAKVTNVVRFLWAKLHSR